MPIAVLFDLDGTLVDTLELLLGSARHAFAERRDRAPTDAEWTAGIGTPLREQLAPWAASPAELAALVERYRAHQLLHHDHLTQPYPDVLAVVAALRAAGHPLGIVTSKADAIARRTIAHVGLEGAFDTIVGCDAAARAKPHPDPVLLALDRLGVPASDALFVGDSPHDVASGNAAGVATVAALWGFFAPDVLAASHPTYTIGRITELPAVVRAVSRAG